ncbi:helix-turn-helix domain-containing protein [Flavobacterium branchiarum]|uniref:Helix-turn-helix domain-containing protein n=1 Tax=Flavobacterium branchiarum TaxID=1114870 RepID=A0ABV5FGB2_9FLAO|nr:helix-turn-helix domain-containing protein [Flavobacterium branchiarum]MDN3672883.1 helix-turn-helix domain-containing protein [Flavobacterium branchiarum]
MREKEKEINYKECTVQECDTDYINLHGSTPLYSIFLLEGTGKVSVDLVEYAFEGKIILFTSPYQIIHFDVKKTLKTTRLQFHGDFYCIEYHKKEVACNGLLFNNIYQQPFVNLEKKDFVELDYILGKLILELDNNTSYAMAVVRAYLQLILALCSKIKYEDNLVDEEKNIHHPLIQFKELLENNFREERQPSFYAAQMGISPNSFSKLCKQYFLKTPSTLIQERVILEAKKLIHLTYKSMKQIAAELNFDDENYFSRYFKKHTGITPTAFREDVGISIVADLSR